MNHGDTTPPGRSTEALQIRVSGEEKQLLRRAAGRVGLPVGTWGRDRLLELARRTTHEERQT